MEGRSVKVGIGRHALNVFEWRKILKENAKNRKECPWFKWEN